jgi:hypothetical protein
MDVCFLRSASIAVFAACLKMKTAIVWLFWDLPVLPGESERWPR